jgi:hypothetical protein
MNCGRKESGKQERRKIRRTSFLFSCVPDSSFPNLRISSAGGTGRLESGKQEFWKNARDHSSIPAFLIHLFRMETPSAFPLVGYVK